MRQSRHLLGVFGFLAAFSGSPTRPARADDQPFVSIYTTDIEPAHGREFEQYLSWSATHAQERFNAFEERSELEYGLTDSLQGSLYLDYDFEQSRTHPTGRLETTTQFGVSGELIWRVLDPSFDWAGVALYVEPAWGAKHHSFETKLLAQKNLLNGRLRMALNTNFEDDWTMNSSGYERHSVLEFDLGSAYNLTPDLSLGVEFDNEHGFSGELLGGSAAEASNSFFFGPTVQYIAHPWSLTWGAQFQLPLATNPSGAPGRVDAGYTASDERFRTTLRFTTDF
ncbi:MAG: hypothetical protein JOZ55_03950 [Alphaproteobacteria bacterium]|nr:hypothetical protein [Alphaproteobacteria bacterium]